MSLSARTPDRPSVRFTRERGLATITLDAPKGNAINLALAEQLRDAVRQCHTDRGVRAVLVQASGKTFCAGGDLAEFQRQRGDRAGAIEAIASRFHEAESLLLTLDVPVIIAVQGAAAGAGMTLALLGDIVVASEHARFVPGFVRLGLSADGGSTWVLPRLIGARRASQWLLTGQTLDASDALAWGVVSEVCGAGVLTARVNEIARALSNGPTPAFRAIKRLLRQSAGSTFEAQARREAQEIAHHAETSNGEEGIMAVFEKREPRFIDAVGGSG